MRQLPRRARIYLVFCYILGASSLCWYMLTYTGPLTVEHWLLGAVLAAAAAVCQVFLVARRSTRSTTGHRNDHLTLAPLFAALLLLPRPILALVIIATFIPEWFVYRRKWYGQIFNMSVYLIAGIIARWALFYLTGEYRLDDPHKLFSIQAFGVLAMIPIFEITQALLLAIILKLVTGQSFRQTGLFSPESLLLEVGLICAGVGFATSFIISPLYGVIAVLPLVLIFDALHVPNLKEEAATDPKTGLANTRHFNAVIARDLERAERSGQPLSLLVGDLDYLRNINNTYGHQAGDTVLIGIANIIRRHIRGADLAARFGGEEFVILLSDTDAVDAQIVAERLRKELEETRFDVGHVDGPISATISIGIAAYPRDGRTHEALMREADLSVYQAKRDGRNRVIVAGRASRELAVAWAQEHLVSAPAPSPAAQREPAGPRWRFLNEVTRTSINIGQSTVEKFTGVSSTKGQGEARQERRTRRKPDVSLRVLAFIACVVIAGIVGLVPGLFFGLAHLWLLALFAGLTILAEQVAVNSIGNGKLSVSVVPILGAAFLFGEAGILAVALGAAISQAVKGRSPIHRGVFNFGMILLSAEGAVWMFRLLSDAALLPATLNVLLLPAVVAGLAYHVVNQSLLCSVRGMHENRTPWAIWLSEYRWLWPYYGVFGALGLVTALAEVAFGWLGVLALMAPVAMMHLSIKQYMGHTSGYMAELRNMNNRLTDSYESTLQALTKALDTRDEETEEHSQRVKQYTLLIARQLNIPAAEVEDMSRGALLHDIGKIGVPDAILLKPGRLTESERSLMRKHPEIGYRMIAHIPFLARPAQIVLHHHEMYDGSGYPAGLSGSSIPLGARIFAVADTFDAMTSDRPYRRALPIEVALAEIKRCSGSQFDPQVVAAMLQVPRDELLAVAHHDTVPADGPLPFLADELHLIAS